MRKKTKNKIQDVKFAIGLMSGTSVDALDAALISFQDHFQNLQLIDFQSLKFSSQLKKTILKNMSAKSSSVVEICELNMQLSVLAAKIVKRVLEKARMKPQRISVIGYHGQTLHHLPQKQRSQIGSTLQIGDGPVLAHLTGIPVVNNFRTKDMANGGEGAPLVPYAHSVLFGKQKKNVAIQNIGGISNVTYLGQKTKLAFDTGPGNMLIDGLMQELYRKPFDASGRVAKKGRIDNHLANDFLKDSYLKKAPPKSTGRERYGLEYAQKWLKKARDRQLPKKDIIATATNFTAKSIFLNYEKFLPLKKINQMIVCGGGSKNQTLLSHLKDLFDFPIVTSQEYGFDPQTIEAISFAILGYQALQQRVNQFAKLTGGKSDLSLGQISYP